MIQVAHLTYEYPGKRALSDVSFSIDTHAITALVGPNGAGKTTLLKCMAALIRPFHGTVVVNGIDVFREPRRSHRIMGFLPDFFGLYDSLSVEQALTYFALAQKMEKSRVPDRVREVIRLMDLTDKQRARVGSLSRGMRQRLAIGQALIHDPEVLLLDEPASGLDPEARYALSNLFIDLNRAGKTIVVSSHILSELDQYATDLLVIREGRVAERPMPAEPAPAGRLLRVRLLERPEGLDAVLTRFPEADLRTTEGTTLHLGFTGDDQRQHDLLRAMVGSGLTVLEFSAEKETLQSRYLETATEQRQRP
jgi:ABC-2 type transport system ATP-binding protein